jgi:homoserine dehydrogenase
MNQMSTASWRRARVALLGFGTVGSAVAARLAHDRIPGLRLTHIFDRGADAARDRTLGDEVVWTTRIDDVLASDADLVVEVLGGVEAPREWIRGALARGKAVVTANKQVIARHGRELLALASRQGRQLRFEAAVGAAMPIVGAIRETLAGDRITRIDAVLNGTTSFVLSHVEATGSTIGDALRLAQARGLAEADPSADIDGDDAAAKLSILCALAFGAEVDVDSIERRSIDAIVPDEFAALHRRGRTIRQIASASFDWARGALTAFVGPREVPRASFLGRVNDADNAALITCERAGIVGLFGCGAGGEATAVAVISDLLAIARDPAAIIPPPRWRRVTIVDRSKDGVDRADRVVDASRVQTALSEAL